MNKAASTIEINGTSYDAASGRVVANVKKVASQVREQSRVIDGFVKKSGGTVSKATTNRVEKITAKKQPRRDISPPRGAKQVHSRPQKSNALMRRLVTKPKSQVGEAARTFIKPSVSKAVGIEQERRSRANAITRDSRVQRFGVPRPSQKIARREITAPTRPISAKANSVQAVVPAPMPSMVLSVSHQKLERLLDEALMHADAHKQMLKARSRYPFSRLPRWLLISLLLAILILLAGFFAWRDIPQVAIKVAGVKAHVNASLPSYTPSGYSFAGPITSSNGAVTIKYADKSSSSHAYLLTEQKSSWDSSSLAANVLTPSAQVQTSEVQGTTVFIYGNQTNATWVNNSVRYTLKNNASLASDQILNIVQSM